MSVPPVDPAASAWPGVPPAAPAAPAPAPAPGAAAPSPADPQQQQQRLQDVRAQVDSVRQVMAANVSAVLDRGERLDALEMKTEDLGGQAAAFQRQGAALRRKMWLSNAKTKLFAALAIGLVLLVLFSLACFTGGRNCLGGGSKSDGAFDGPAPLLGGDGLGGGGSSSDGGTAAVLPDGSVAVISTPDAQAPGSDSSSYSPAPVDANTPGVLTTDEAAVVLGDAGRR